MKKSAILFAFIVATITVNAQHEVFVKSDVAIQGYDPVAYFKESKPVMGKKQFAYTWNDATWNFASADNLATFKASPEKFAPQYGGYCAYGMADGHKAPTSPDAWTIVDNKLYLNYNTSVKDLWNKSQGDNIKKADGNWPTVKKEKD